MTNPDRLQKITDLTRAYKQGKLTFTELHVRLLPLYDQNGVQ